MSESGHCGDLSAAVNRQRPTSSYDNAPERGILEVVNPTSLMLAEWAAAHFRSLGVHAADVISGPKRETWFSSEVFVALHRNTFLDECHVPSFSCWGEEQYRTVFGKIEADPTGSEGLSCKPDVVCYLPENGVDAVTAVIELKLILDRADEDTRPIIRDLRKQLLNARQLFRGAQILGFIFIAAAPITTPTQFIQSVGRIKAEVESELPSTDGFGWVAAYECAMLLNSVRTSFEYPAMHVSLALGALELQAAIPLS
jgi:hypothetical protein